VTQQSRLRLLPNALSFLTEIKSVTAAKHHNGLISYPRHNNSLRLFSVTWNIRCDSISMCSVTRRSRLRLLPYALSFLTEIKSATVATYRNELISSHRSNNSLLSFSFTWNITVRFNFLVLDDTRIPITIGFRTHWAVLQKSNQLLLPGIATNWSHPLGAITFFSFSVSRETLRCDSISKCSMTSTIPWILGYLLHRTGLGILIYPGLRSSRLCHLVSLKKRSHPPSLFHVKHHWS